MQALSRSTQAPGCSRSESVLTLLCALAAISACTTDSQGPTYEDMSVAQPKPLAGCTVKVEVAGTNHMAGHRVDSTPACTGPDESLSCPLTMDQKLILRPQFTEPLTAIQWDGPCTSSTTCVVRCSDFDSPSPTLTGGFVRGVDCRAGTESWCLDSGLPGVRGLWGVSETDYWAVGVGGLRSHHMPDGSWVQYLPTDTKATLHGIWGLDNKNLWAVGEEGTVLQSDGTTWSEVPDIKNRRLVNGEQLYAIAGANKFIWIVGESGLTLRYDGSRWNSLLIMGSPTLMGVWALEDGSAVAVGTHGGVWEFVPNDMSWKKITLANDPRQNFYAVWGTGTRDKGRTIWLGGEPGTSTEDTILSLVCPNPSCGSAVPVTPHGCKSRDAIRALWGDGKQRVWGGGDNGIICLSEAGVARQEKGRLMLPVLSLWGATTPPNDPKPGVVSLRAGTSAGILFRNLVP